MTWRLRLAGEENGIAVENIVGDGAYSESALIEYANDKEIHLISKLSKTVMSGNRRKIVSRILC